MIDITSYGIRPFGSVPNARQLEHFKMKKAFFHFGVNTFTDLEWGNGTEREHLFAPTECNVEQWIRTIKEAGFDLAILTAKHHDGFCLWASRHTEHSVSNSPYQNGKGDIVREFTDACRKHGIKVGLYLSPWDRYAPFWGTDEYSAYYAKQLTELMTNYGEIHEVWWDGAGSTQARYDWARWTAIVRQYQPQCVIFGCLGAAEFVDVRWVGTEEGRAGEDCWATIDPETIVVENCADLNSGKWGGSHFIPAETNTSIRPG
jgi:alpha-L-fucosidase